MWEKLYKTLDGFWIKWREEKKEKRSKEKGRLGRKRKVIKERRKER